jgi:polar amino acid transport system substrate-binding protein
MRVQCPGASSPAKRDEPDEAERDLVWNAAVGIRKPDDQLLVAIDAALDRLRADGTVETIYANYGIPLLPAR